MILQSINYITASSSTTHWDTLVHIKKCKSVCVRQHVLIHTHQHSPEIRHKSCELTSVSGWGHNRNRKNTKLHLIFNTFALLLNSCWLNPVSVWNHFGNFISLGARGDAGVKLWQTILYNSGMLICVAVIELVNFVKNSNGNMF